MGNYKQASDEILSSDSTGHDDPLNIDAQGVDVRGTVFVIPLDAPLPNELADLEVPTGSLYKRLKALDQSSGTEFGFVPISGGELIAIERVWRQLCAAPKIAVLTELPGARYDIVFMQAKRSIGLRSVDWPSVATALSERVRVVQRTKDSKPWNLEDGAESITKQHQLRGPSKPNLSRADSMLAAPSEEGTGDDD